ncbi:MAG: hypothetical protein JXA96_15615 [Sedimentisphaerales bacterium]|nr:hypothetical protein [Sedimentisphaerales bacterium]
MKIVLKIDLCGSKIFFDSHKENPEIRNEIGQKLVDSVTRIYPYADKQYPDGTMYGMQGDCTYLILDKASVAIRYSIDFLTDWYSQIDNLPDCRIVIDIGDIGEKNYGGRLELTSVAFENISIIEKIYRAGQIGVTEGVVKVSDKTIVQFINRREDSTESRTIVSYLANYENPRIVQDSSLVHALFIASDKASDVREKAYEALIIEALLNKLEVKLPCTEIIQYLKEHQCTDISTTHIISIISKSDYLETEDSQYVKLNTEKKKDLDLVRQRFETSKKDFVDLVIDRIASAIRVHPSTIKDKFNVNELIEKYLCAIFLEIRMVANYFSSKNAFYENISSDEEFDYILKKGFFSITKGDREKFILIKQIFLSIIKHQHKVGNVYIASIFHNVLLLYYLNRNERYIHDQLSVLKEKKIYLDTNTYYSLRCKSSDFYDKANYCLKKCILIGMTVKLYDISVNEYNNSIESVLHNYQNTWNIQNYDIAYNPWILKEYRSNKAAYRSNFNYCVNMHYLPTGALNNRENTEESIINELKKQDIIYEKITDVINKEKLGSLYDSIFEAKKKFDPLYKTKIIPGSVEAYSEKVLHDANCIYYTKCTGDTPFELEKSFLTCDSRLAKIRKKNSEYNCVITLNEFHDFMLPYFLLSDTILSDPIEIPNFLLASVLSDEISKLTKIESVIGDYLFTKEEVKQDFKVLAAESNKERYQNIKSKIEDVYRSEDKKVNQEIIDEIDHVVHDYIGKVLGSISESMNNEDALNKNKEIESLKKELSDAKLKVEILQKKELKRKRYFRKQERKKKK